MTRRSLVSLLLAVLVLGAVLGYASRPWMSFEPLQVLQCYHDAPTCQCGIGGTFEASLGSRGPVATVTIQAVPLDGATTADCAVVVDWIAWALPGPDHETECKTH
jgi:hypothetical protein